MRTVIGGEALKLEEKFKDAYEFSIILLAL